MSNYCYYADDALELVEKSELKKIIDEYAEHNTKQTFVLRRPLSLSLIHISEPTRHF